MPKTKSLTTKTPTTQSVAAPIRPDRSPQRVIAARTAVPVLNAKMKARGRVPLDAIHEFYEEVLTELQISPVDTTHYGRLTAQLHSILCIECPHIRWVEKDHSFHWTDTTVPAPANNKTVASAAHEDEESSDEE